MGNNLSNINGNIWINNHTSIIQNNISYILNFNDKTAKLNDFYPGTISNISIPRSIRFGLDEYIVTSIAEGSFKNTCGYNFFYSISFPPDSEIRTIERKGFKNSDFIIISVPSHITTIHEKAFSLCENLYTVEFPSKSEVQIFEKNAFKDSRIEELIIPSTVLELQDGWCSGLYKLTDVKLMPKNKNYIYFDNKYIIGKSDVNNDNYDILSFARRDLKHAEIPSFIKRIGSSAFSETLIENIVIPFNVEEIGERIFDMCKEIKKVEFTTDSNIKSIGKKAFYDSTIEILNIPSSVIDLKDGWCAGIRLKKINVIQCKQQNILMINDQIIVEKSDIKSDDYDVLVYAKPDINEIILPSFIKKIQPYIFTKSEITSIVIPSKVIEIGKHAFQNCDNLQNIEFVSDSELQIIGKKSFADLRIKKIRIPSSVTKICEQAFAGCYQLKKIQIPNSSKLQIIEFGAFRGTKIKTINIPSNILELKNGWCAFTSKLIDITIIPNEQQNILLYDDKFLVGKSDISSDEYDVLHFIIRKKYKKIIIPSFIKIISSYSLQYDLFVKSIFIPSKATQIKEHSFIYCENLTHIEIPNNSNLSIIEKDIFSNSLVSSLYIPSHVKEIRTIHFNILQIIEFADDVNINDNNICTDLIDYSDSLIIMIPVI